MTFLGVHLLLFCVCKKTEWQYDFLTPVERCLPKNTELLVQIWLWLLSLWAWPVSPCGRGWGGAFAAPCWFLCCLHLYRESLYLCQRDSVSSNQTLRDNHMTLFVKSYYYCCFCGSGLWDDAICEKISEKMMCVFLSLGFSFFFSFFFCFNKELFFGSFGLKSLRVVISASLFEFFISSSVQWKTRVYSRNVCATWRGRVPDSEVT